MGKQPALTTKQRTLIQPYLAELRKRYEEVAKTGASERPCILCEEAGVAKCYACPVFGEAVTGAGRGHKECEGYGPTPPRCVEVRATGVRLPRGADRISKLKDGTPRQQQTAREQGQAWGRAMVAWLDAMDEAVLGR